MSWKKLGEVKESKKGGFYIDIGEEVTLKPGTPVFLQPPTSAADNLLRLGKITQEEYDEKVSRIPSYVIYNVVLPPPRD